MGSRKDSIGSSDSGCIDVESVACGIDKCANKQLCVARIAAETDAYVHRAALNWSGGLLTICVFAHIAFQIFGKRFEMPDIAWVILLSPWLGTGVNKLGKIADKHMSGGKPE